MLFKVVFTGVVVDGVQRRYGDVVDVDAGSVAKYVDAGLMVSLSPPEVVDVVKDIVVQDDVEVSLFDLHEKRKLSSRGG